MQVFKLILSMHAMMLLQLD